MRTKKNVRYVEKKDDKRRRKDLNKNHGLFSYDLGDDDQEDAHQDERIRQRWTVELLLYGQEMDRSPYSPSLSPQQHGSCTKTSAQRRWKGKKRKQTG